MTSFYDEDRPSKHRKIFTGIGVAGILIGVYVLGFGLYFVYLSVSLQTASGFVEILSTDILAGIWFIVCGSLSFAASYSPNRSNVISGIVVAILASVAAVALLIRESFLAASMDHCIKRPNCSQFDEETFYPHIVMAVLCFAEFVLTILQSALSSGCCCRRN